MKAIVIILAAIVIAAACAAIVLIGHDGDNDNGKDGGDNDGGQPEKVDGVMKLTIDGVNVPVTWNDNASVDAIRAMAKDGLSVNTHRYGGFEQVGSLGKSVVRDDSSMTSSPGDIFLYSGNQIVLFFGENSYSYTQLGKIDLSDSEITSLLDKESAVVTLCLE